MCCYDSVCILCLFKLLGMMYLNEALSGILLDLDEADSSITQLTSSLQRKFTDFRSSRDFGLLFIAQIYPLLWLNILFAY